MYVCGILLCSQTFEVYDEIYEHITMKHHIKPHREVIYGKKIDKKR